MRVTHDSITDTDNLVALIQGSSFPVVLNVLILEREENRSTAEKNPRSTGEINYEKLQLT